MFSYLQHNVVNIHLYRHIKSATSLRVSAFFILANMIMKKYLLLSLLTCLFFTQQVQAKAYPASESTAKSSKYNPIFVPFDLLIFRPVSLAVTVAGTALFVAMSPITALSSIAPPHDAFERVADVFIVVPATYTFLRPMGQVLCPGDCRPKDIK